MKIDFTLGDYSELIDDIDLIFEDIDNVFTETEGEYCFCLSAYRLVFPRLNAAFRLGQLYSIEDEAPTDDVIIAKYAEDELDPDMYDSTTSRSIEYILLNDYGISQEKSQLERCYIDLDEFVIAAEISDLLYDYPDMKIWDYITDD